MRYHTRKHGANEADIFYSEIEHDPDNVVVIFPTEADGLMVSVSEEHAVDSYNSTFECSLSLPEAEAKRLRDLLNEWFPR